jgi:hypothetical protein
MKQKSNILKYAIIGTGIGTISSALVIGTISSKILLENYQFNNWLNNKTINTELNIIESNQGIYVPILKYITTKRTTPLYTDSLATCSALTIDDKAKGIHYLAHFTSANDISEIKESIRDNFSNLNNLEITIITGKHPNSIATKNIYKSLKKLNLLDDVKYIQSEKILIKQGDFYLPNTF